MDFKKLSNEDTTRWLSKCIERFAELLKTGISSKMIQAKVEGLLHEMRTVQKTNCVETKEAYDTVLDTTIQLNTIFIHIRELATTKQQIEHSNE